MVDYFSNDELRCKHCGELMFNDGTKQRLNQLRENLGFPLVLTSAYRCRAYNKQIGATQTHATGQAVDISCQGDKAYKVIAEATKLGFTGIGVKQKGSGRFIHLDDLEASAERVRPIIWSY